MARVLWIGIVAALLIAGYLRLVHLDQAPFRADELNMYNAVERSQSLVDLWRNPPWKNQIPSAETLAIIFSNVFPSAPDELRVRLPFALFGWATLLLLTFWTHKRWGIETALWLVLWAGLNPFHLYESREAYYYVLLMFFSAGSTMACMTVAARCDKGKQHVIPWKPLGIWAVWVVLACHMHMSFWVFAAVQWLYLMACGRMLQDVSRKEFWKKLIIVAGVIGVIMIRWVFRAVSEIFDVAGRGGHFGDDLFWILPRLFPLYAGGINYVGITVVVVVLLSGLCAMRSLWTSDAAFRSLTWLLWGGFAASLAYVGGLGGGVAKFTYFAAYWPLLLLWSAILISAAVKNVVVRLPHYGMLIPLALGLVLIAGLAPAAWHIVKLEGKPTPYKLLQQELDQMLPVGTVVVVDRWFEPWNEMAVHAPTNVFVTFTVPDEPYEAYVRNQWRNITRQHIESGRAQAFLMMNKNHWEQEGVWEWPSQYFARHATIRNESGLWLRQHGFAPTAEYYHVMTNRLVLDLFYDLPEDRIERARQQGRPVFILYGPEWGYSKPWRETGNMLNDYRVLIDEATIEAHNLTDSPLSVDLSIRAAALPRAKMVRINHETTVRFPAEQLVEQRHRMTLEPGLNTIRLSDPSGGGTQLFVADIQVNVP